MEAAQDLRSFIARLEAMGQIWTTNRNFRSRGPAKE